MDALEKRDPGGGVRGGDLGRRFVREPLVQFVVLGAVIFAVYGLTRKDEAAVPDGARAAPDHRIVITPAELESLRQSFRLAWKRDPEPAELGDQIETFVLEEILFREGRALGLDQGDVVVRRRIIEKMSALARPTGVPIEPAREVLRRWYEHYPHRFRQPTRVSFEQRFFDPKRRSEAVQAASAAVAALAPGERRDPTALRAEDEFVLPRLFTEKDELQIAHLFGAPFAAALAAAPTGQWSGPVTSTFGPHLVFVIKREEARLPPFEEVEKHVRADWLTVTNRGVKPAAETLLPRYEVKLDPAVPPAIATAKAVAPLLEAR